MDVAESGVILIVDDTPTNLELLLDCLEHSGFKVVVAEDGRRALDLATYAPPDLILLDILMPGMDGFETCRQLKSNPLTQAIPVIFLTAVAEHLDKVKGLKLGAVDYITKPLEYEEVLARVKIHLRMQNLTKQLMVQNQRLADEIAVRKQVELEREAAFEALQRSEAQLRRLIEANVLGIIFGDLDGHITDANNAFLNLVGYEHSDLDAGQLNWQEITAPKFKQTNQAVVEELVTTGVFNAVEKEYIRKDGSLVPVLVGGVLLEKNQNQLIGFVLDLTSYKQAENKIREQAALLDITPDAVLVKDLDNTIRYWSRGAERLYGWTSQEALGRNVNQLLYLPGLLSQLQAPMSGLTKADTWQGELYQTNHQGQEIIVASRWTLMRDAQGEPQAILTVNTDITEKKQLENQFLRTQRLESLGTLAGGIAHDLNNILTPILATAQLLQFKFSNTDEQNQHLFKIIETSTRRGAALVKQVLQFARGVEGKRATVQITHLISEVKQIAEKTFPKSVQLFTDVDPALWPVTGDATHLHQVLINLVVNARDAMATGGRLTISAKNLVVDEHYARKNIDALPGPHICITVTDTGTGMLPEVADRMFEPFFTTKEFGSGTGLGLSTVRGIIKSHNGFVDVFSKVGEGTVFKVFLPAVEAPIVSLSGCTEIEKGNAELVLVIDDEATVLETTKLALEAFNYKVLTAKDGVEAIALCNRYKDKIDIALVDMMMPSMDGLTTIGALQVIHPNLKTIVVSGFLSDEQLKLSSSRHHFIAKPYTTKELLQTLQGALRQPVAFGG